jgi:GT2 family glycosyltransferase
MTGEFPRKDFGVAGDMTIRVQSVLYNLPLENIVRSLEYLDNAAFNARKIGAAQMIMIAYGDCSPDRTIDREILQNLRRRFSNLSKIEYTYFGANLGSAAGHNRLLKKVACDFVMILNPDVLASPTLIGEMVTALGRPGVGLVEARQLPIEHPKDYDVATGETSWASTACAMGPTHLFHRLSGFDAETFFLYCDDVDFSWRIRLAGYKVVHQCSAVVFHDKRLTNQGGWIAGAAERYYSAEAALLLPYKYFRSDLTDRYFEIFAKSDDEVLQKAAMNFELRRKTGRLPTPIDEDHSVAQFVDGNYAHHRFKSQ